MKATPKNAVLDRLLITRIHEPAFEECDVFLPEFRTDGQIKAESEGMQQETSNPNEGNWKRSKAGELGAFVGEDVEGGMIEEKGVRYQLQMWEMAS